MSNDYVWNHPAPNPLWDSSEVNKTLESLALALLGFARSVRGREWADVNDPGAHFAVGVALAKASAKLVNDPLLIDELARGTGSSLVKG